MSLTTSRPAMGVAVTVTIDRTGGDLETLLLAETTATGAFISQVAPAEPHEFNAQLRLTAEDKKDVLPFHMAEPEEHGH